MAWAQYTNGKSPDETSATDGDMDIAYSLLLADKQWGSKGAINYLQSGRDMIAAIMQYEINQETWSVLLVRRDRSREQVIILICGCHQDFMPGKF